MDCTISYLYKALDPNFIDKTILERLDIEENHYVLHTHGSNLNLIHLNDVSQTDLSTKQLLSNIGSNSQRFPQTYTIGLENIPASYSYNDFTHELFILDFSGNISTISRKELSKRVQISGGESEVMEVDNNNGDEIFDDLLMRPRQKQSRNTNQCFLQTVEGAFHIKTMKNILIVFTKKDSVYKILVYYFERSQRKLTLVPKREHILNHVLDPKIASFISKDSLYKQILEESFSPTMLFGTDNGCVVNVNAICELPSTVYDLKQKIVEIIDITLMVQENEIADNSSMMFSQNDNTQSSFEGYALCFVGEKGKIGTAIFNPDKTFRHFFVAQLSKNIVCCVGYKNIIIAASTQFISVYRVVGRIKVSKKQQDNNNRSVHIDFIHLKDYKITNVKQLIVSPINPNEVICLNSAQSVMLLNFKSALSSNKNNNQQGKDISTLLGTYAAQNKCNQTLKETSSKLNQTLMDVSVVGEWIKLLKNNKTSKCLSLDTNVSRIIAKSRKKIILSIKVSNSSPIAIPEVTSLCLQYKKSFRASSSTNRTNCETFKCGSIPSGLKKTFSLEIVEDALDFSPLQFDVFFQFTVSSSMPTISCFVETFHLNVLDFCDVTAAASLTAFSNPGAFYLRPKENNKILGNKTFKCHLVLDSSKCGNNKTIDQFQELIAPVLHIPITAITTKSLQSQQQSRYLMEHVKGDVAELQMVFGKESTGPTSSSTSCSLTIRTSNVVFLASIHQYLLTSLKEHVVLKDFDENKVKEIKDKLEEIGLDQKTNNKNNGRTNEELMKQLIEIYVNQRQ